MMAIGYRVESYKDRWHDLHTIMAAQKNGEDIRLRYVEMYRERKRYDPDWETAFYCLTEALAEFDVMPGMMLKGAADEYENVIRTAEIMRELEA